MLLLTVYLTNRITRSLHRQRQGLARQRDRIMVMSQQLKDQQRAMIQHEKMVALGQMAAGVAHEIANPLASADSLLELMRRHPEKDGPSRIALLREQVQRIKQILQQMTAFAHPGETSSRLRGVNQAVEAALSMVRFDHRLRRVNVERQLSEDANAVQVESQAMEQVIVNLVLNALDAMEDVPTPRLLLRTACEGEWCVIGVTDSGHGIAPEHMDHIFEPFFTTKPVGKGTGLGLAISYSLVRKLGGRIDVRSEVGRGTTFTICWPISTMVSYSREPPNLGNS
jgi:two-component system, NtrC family, sensor kinase